MSPIPTLGASLPTPSQPSTFPWDVLGFPYEPGVLEPATSTYSTVNPLEITRTLGITVPSSVLGASLVGREPGHATILVHGDEVQRPVQAARHLRRVDVDGELVAQEVEHLVGVIARLRQVDSSADVGALAVLGDEADADRVAGRGHAVGVCIVGTVDAAVLGAGLAVRAEGGIPGVAGVAVVVAVDGVSPAPVGVNDEPTVDGCTAAAFTASAPAKRGSDLGADGAGFLGVGTESG